MRVLKKNIRTIHAPCRNPPTPFSSHGDSTENQMTGVSLASRAAGIFDERMVAPPVDADSLREKQQTFQDVIDTTEPGATMVTSLHCGGSNI